MSAAIAIAQDYPSRPVRLISGSPGSTSDISARFIAQKLSERWGQQVVVDNRPGAGGIIGAEIGAAAAPDGHTLTVGHIGTHASAQFLFKKLPYDPVKDFAPISLMTNSGIALAVQAKAGKVRPLAVLSAKRFSASPEIPSAVEAGFPGLDSSVWFGLFAPAKTPKAIVTRINRDVAAALQLPEAKAALLAQGAEAVPTTPEEFDRFLKSEIAKWGRVIKEAGIKAN